MTWRLIDFFFNQCQRQNRAQTRESRPFLATVGLKPALKQAEIDKAVTMHGLRHSYASMLILLGRKIPEISRYLGHADVVVTMRVYAHFLKPKKQDTMSDLERLIQNG